MARSKKTVRKIVSAGRGRVIQSPGIRDAIISLSGKRNPHVVYLGTASYEKQTGYDLQAAGFADVGCTVEHLKVTAIKNSPQNRSMIATALNKADIIAASGGNTLYAMKQWKKLGIDKLLRRANDRGAVLCGGSAGAICWFDAGHSDSRDPTTLLHVNPNLSEEEKKSWNYICVKGLGLIPGVCCPHHDSTQSNGLPRSDDFDGMLRRRMRKSKSVPNIGVCIDDQAALLVDGDSFRVLSTDGKSGVCRKDVQDDGSIEKTVFSPSEEFKSLDHLIGN